MTDMTLKTEEIVSTIRTEVTRPPTVSEILSALGLTAAMAGALMAVSPTGEVDPIDLGGTGQLLVAGATAPEYSGTGLTWASDRLSGSGSTAPVAQASNAWSLGNGTGRFGTSVIVDGVGAGSITTAGGVLAAGPVVSDRSSGSQVTLVGMTKRSAGGSQQYAANFISNGAGTYLYLQLLDAANAFYTNAFAYDYANKRFALADIITPECSFHVGGGILASGTGAAGRFIKSVYNVVAGGATSSDGIQIQGRAGGAGGWVGTITTAALSASQTYTMPDATIVVAGSATAFTSGRIPYATTGGILTDSAYITVVSGRIISLGGASNPGALNLNGDVGSARLVSFTTGGVNRWLIYAGGAAESGSDAGSQFTVSAYTDAGVLIDNPINITRAASGAMSLSRSTVIGATSLLGSERLRVYAGTMGTPDALSVIIAAGKIYSGDTSSTSIRSAGGITASGDANISGLVTASRSLVSGSALQAQGTGTLSGALTDGYLSSLNLAPTYDQAFNVARHNYIICANPVLTNGATMTDACVFRFNAAAGTHKAVDAGTTKATPGAVDAWVKFNINGAVFYFAGYANKTS